jgi:Fic family protein
MSQTQLLGRIDFLKNEALSLSRKPEFEKVFWDKYRLEFNYNSNHIEGNTLTYGHTQLLLLFDKVVADYSFRELEEMKAHDVALKIVREAALDDSHILTEKFIKELNEIVLVRPFYKEAITADGQPTRRLIEPGTYKKYPNSVLLENGEVFNYASPEETPALIGDLMNWYRTEQEKKELHPVQIAAIFHYRFVRIHPFDDSNGRTARLLMNYILIRNGYAPLVIESADKKGYLTALNKADTGDLQAFIEYISQYAEKWQSLYVKALKGESIEEQEDFRKEIELLKRKLNGDESRLEKVYSKKVCQEVLTDTILPLITAIIKELSVFDDFYLTKTVWIQHKEKGVWRDLTIESLPPIISKISDGFIKAPPVEFQFQYEHKQYKKETAIDFSYHTKLIFGFEQTHYLMQDANGETYFRRLYHQPLTNEEIGKIAASLAKKELSTIKKAVDI